MNDLLITSYQRLKVCKRLESCSAPLCPMDEGSLGSGIWYPDEEICKLQAFCKLNWVQNQKKIAKKARIIDLYFTHRMLQQNCIIGKGISGLDPDHDIKDMEKDEAKWLKEHPEKRKLSEEEKEKLRNRMDEVRQGVNPLEKGTNYIENMNLNKQSVQDFNG